MTGSFEVMMGEISVATKVDRCEGGDVFKYVNTIFMLQPMK